MRKAEAGIILALALLGAALLIAGEKGDEEGEYYGGKWPSDVPKKLPVKFYLPFPAGKSFGQLPGAASHTALQNKHAIDFSMRIGSPVLASADGIVIKIIESGPDRGGRQNSLIIQHADGMCTCYLHLKNKGAVPKLGDFVFQGDVVAYSGASGTGVPHLHFSVNKFEMLESVPIKFAESGSSKKWVSQNHSFEQKYAKKLKVYRETELRIVLGPKLGLWEGTIAARKQVEEIKPDKDADVRLKRIFAAIEQAGKSFDEMLKNHLAAAKKALENKNFTRALELAQFGAEDFKGTQHEQLFTGMLAELKELPDYDDLRKGLKKSIDRRRKLEKAFKTDLKGADEKKIYKAYKSFVRKYKDSPETKTVEARMETLKNAIEKKKK